MQAACLSLINDTRRALHYPYSKLSTLLGLIHCRAELQRNQQEDWQQHADTQMQQGTGQACLLHTLTTTPEIASLPFHAPHNQSCPVQQKAESLGCVTFPTTDDHQHTHPADRQHTATTLALLCPRYKQAQQPEPLHSQRQASTTA
jgi:hypothetical protein